jgi:SSS family solute:Na+ symporter
MPNENGPIATGPDTPRPVATSGDNSDYTLSIEEVAERYAKAGHARTIRTLQRYCVSGHLDARKVATTLGDKYFVTPRSVARHIAQIVEMLPLDTVATDRDQPRQVATTVAAQESAPPPQPTLATHNDTARQPATDDAQVSRYVALLERDNEFLREQQTFDFAVVVLYVLVTIGIVVWASRRQHNTEDYFLGNRRMPWLAVGLSIMATLLSSLTYLGLTGEVVKNGIAGFMTQAAIIPAAFLVTLLFIPFFMRLRFTSAYEYLEHRFDYRARLLGGALFLLLRLGWVSLVMYSGSLALAKMAGWNFYGTIFVLGAAATLYTFFGGLEGVIWTDVLQALMLFGGAFAIVVYVWIDTGAGPAVWWEAAGHVSKAHTQPEWFSFDPTKRITLGTALISGFFWQICTHCSDQVVLQRYASTPSLAAARGSYLTNLVAVLAITSLLGISGLALLYYYLQHPDRLPPKMTATSAGDELMPHFYATQLPLGFGGLILANFLCDAMQTLVSGVNSITAVAAQDVLEHTPLGRRTVTSRLWFARGVTLVLGLTTTFIALGVAWLAHSSAKNIYDLMPRTFNMFLGPLGSLGIIADGSYASRACVIDAIWDISIRTGSWNVDFQRIDMLL